jgi:hypothetical protein
MPIFSVLYFFVLLADWICLITRYALLDCWKGWLFSPDLLVVCSFWWLVLDWCWYFFLSWFVSPVGFLFYQSISILWKFKFKITVEKSTFSSQNSGTFEAIIRCGWTLLMKCWLLMRLSSWTNLELKRWQMSCWGCLEGACKYILIHFPPKMRQKFLFLLFPRIRRLYLTNLVELRSWR